MTDKVRELAERGRGIEAVAVPLFLVSPGHRKKDAAAAAAAAVAVAFSSGNSSAFRSIPF